MRRCDGEMAWVEPGQLDPYPALGELVANLHALAFELNRKEPTLRLGQPFRGELCVFRVSYKVDIVCCCCCCCCSGCRCCLESTSQGSDSKRVRDCTFVGAPLCGSSVCIVCLLRALARGQHVERVVLFYNIDSGNMCSSVGGRGLRRTLFGADATFADFADFRCLFLGAHHSACVGQPYIAMLLSVYQLHVTWYIIRRF